MKFWNPFRRTPAAPAKRKFEAARPSNIAAGFTAMGGMRSAHEDLRWDLRGLIAHSRQQAQNNDYMKHYLGLVRNNVIGPDGVRMQNKARLSNDTLDKDANRKIEAAWEAWGRMGVPNLEGTLSWKGMQSVVTQTVARDGTILVRQYKGREFGAFSYQQQLLEVDFLDIEMNREEANGTTVRMGIEFDGRGRTVAYHIFTRHPGDAAQRRARERVRIPADQMLLILRPERPGQLLGVPWSYTALRRLNMLRGYEEAAITAARVGAAKMGFIQSQSGDEPASPTDLEGLETTATGALIQEMEPGTIEQLPQGWEYKGHDPAYPSGEMGPFMKVILQGAAAGLGVSYPTLANDLSGANFSSLRAGKGEEREEWRDIQRWIIESYHDRTFRAWLPLAMLSGQVGGLPLSKLDQFAQPDWRARGWAYVSPGEEANANQREMAAMLRSPQSIVAERGDDMETVFEEISEAKKLASEYGLNFDPQPPGHETGGPTPAAAVAAE